MTFSGTFLITSLKLNEPVYEVFVMKKLKIVNERFFSTIFDNTFFYFTKSTYYKFVYIFFLVGAANDCRDNSTTTTTTTTTTVIILVILFRVYDELR